LHLLAHKLGRGSSTLRRLSTTMTAMISAWKINVARQLIAEVIRPPISGPAATPMPPMTLIAPNARARAAIVGDRA
jgi:hypothetical protein